MDNIKIAQTNTRTVYVKEEEKEKQLEKVNAKLKKMIPEGKEAEIVKGKLTSPRAYENKFFKKLNPAEEEKKHPERITFTGSLLGAAATYGTVKIREYHERANVAGYPTVVGGGTDGIDFLPMESFVPASATEAFLSDRSKLKDHVLGNTVNGCIMTSFMLADWAKENNLQPLAFFAEMAPTLIPLSSKGEVNGALNNSARGLNISEGSMSLFLITNLFFRLAQKDNWTVKAGSYALPDGNPATGLMWEW
ncbi:MAG: hypothetical protein ABIH00_02485 [Armatimonadota bacterium]